MKGKRAEFDIQSFLITLVLFIGITVTLGTTAYEMGQSYQPLTSNTISPEFQETYDQLATLESSTEDIENKVVGTNTGGLDAATEFFGDALNSLKLIGTSLSTSKNMMVNMADTLKIPNYLYRIFTTILILMLLTVIIFMIFRYRGN
jgi:hypothetical protein